MPPASPPLPTVIGPADGQRVDLGGLGVRYLLEGGQTGGGFALVEHPIAPRALAAPVHTHEHEDEYSFVLEGRVGVEIGGEVRIGGPGDLLLKPRGIPHAFWNAGEEPARLLEIISPAGFEAYFREIAVLLPPHRPEPDFAGLAAVQAKYALAMDMDSVGRLAAEHGLDMGGR